MAGPGELPNALWAWAALVPRAWGGLDPSGRAAVEAAMLAVLSSPLPYTTTTTGDGGTGSGGGGGARWAAARDLATVLGALRSAGADATALSPALAARVLARVQDVATATLAASATAASTATSATAGTAAAGPRGRPKEQAGLDPAGLSLVLFALGGLGFRWRPTDALSLAATTTSTAGVSAGRGNGGNGGGSGEGAGALGALARVAVRDLLVSEPCGLHRMTSKGIAIA